MTIAKEEKSLGASQAFTLPKVNFNCYGAQLVPKFVHWSNLSYYVKMYATFLLFRISCAL